MTNYDKWKAMSVEDAARVLNNNPHCQGSDQCDGDAFCVDCAIEWLEKESEE